MIKTLKIFPLLFTIALAQKNISGTISDDNSGEPLIGANVIISSDDFNTGAATDQNGYFTINPVPNGDYDIRVSYIGYGDYQNIISITDNSTSDELELDIKLSISAISLQEYVVTASRGKREKITDAPAAISVISELKIRTQSNPNLGDYLKDVKGVDFTQSGLDSYNLSARGFNSSFSSRLLTLTDGRMANVPSLRLIAYNTIPLTSDDVSQIEVVLGPSSALYGPNAHSGVINIISKKPSESLGSIVGYTTGSREFNKLQAKHSGAWNKLSYKMSASSFSAFDWEYIELDEKKNHFRPWSDINFEKEAEELDDLISDGLANFKGWDLHIDRDGDGKVDTIYYGKDNITKDFNRDGISDFPDHHVKNTRMDLRVDYDFSPEHFISLNFGHANARNINITGIGRYLAQDWIYRFYQGRWIYKNWFAQAYLNTSNSGNTQNMRTGEIVRDRSTFFHFQFQHSKEFRNLMNTQFVWGGDYQRTMPETYGTILPDGTGGRNPQSYKRDGKDNDKDGKIDEFDELFVTNEWGLYAQSQTKLNDKFELILASRIDLHSGLTNDESGFTFLNDPLDGSTVNYQAQISPKIGLLYKPSEDNTFRLTASTATNTPSSIGLYLDVLAAQYSIFQVRARGNDKGWSFFRDANNKLMYYDVDLGSKTEFRLNPVPDDAMLYVPAVLGREGWEVQEEDYDFIKPVESEVVYTYEFGYSGIVADKFRLTFDLYNSTYSDFVSDLTWITPVVLDTSESGFYGVDNPDPKILGIVSTKEDSYWEDGGDGVYGSRYVKYGSSDWAGVLDLEVWKKNLSDQRGNWFDIGQNGDTLGAYISDDNFTRSPPLVLTNINYGKVNLWGMDASIYAFISDKITADMTFSFLGVTQFYNRLNRQYDPINAPKFKINGKLAYNAPEGFFGNLGARYIPEFDWSAGVHFGTIESYFVLDGMIGYRFNETYDLLFNVNNLNNDVHREIIGGPKLGRQWTLKLTGRF